MFLFPFEKIKMGANIVLYGAGVAGKDYLAQLGKTGYCNVVAVLDKEHEKIKQCYGRTVYPPDEIKNINNYDYILISAQSESIAGEIQESLLSNGISEEKVLRSEKRDIMTNPRIWGKMTYSGSGEDWLILRMFERLEIENPSYIDIGAHHPYHFSNTALLYENGSRGINIEANPELMKAFYTYRPEDININVGIGCDEGILPFYTYPEKKLISTFSPARVDAIVLEYPELKPTIIDIPVTTISSMIVKYANNKWPHYMSIDIEGLDFEVLSSAELEGGPLVITLEAGFGRTSTMNELMVGKGYALYSRIWGNLTYVKENIFSRLVD